MSVQGYEELVILNRRIDELISSHLSLKDEIGIIKSRNQELERALKEREAKIEELEKRYDRVKLKGALLGEGENAVEAKRRINDLMREIDKCIALLDR